MLYRWRKELAAEPPALMSLVPVVVGAPGEDKAGRAEVSNSSQTIEITLANGRLVKVPVDLDVATLKRLISTLNA